MDYNNDELLEEEVEILEVFSYEMDRYGHKGFYSFYDNIPNGYIIYKDEGKWTVCFNEKRKQKKIKRYTNIYNLCLDVINELKIDSFIFSRMDLRIPRGTRVIITKDTDCPIDEIHEGVIIGSNISRLDSSQPERVYQVLGDDGNTYNGLYGLKIYGDINFRSMEDFIRDTKIQIEENKESIQELHNLNWEMFLTLSEVEKQKDKYLEEDNKTKSK